LPSRDSGDNRFYDHAAPVAAVSGASQTRSAAPPRRRELRDVERDDSSGRIDLTRAEHARVESEMLIVFVTQPSTWPPRLVVQNSIQPATPAPITTNTTFVRIFHA
jgi:hypothetical protein